MLIMALIITGFTVDIAVRAIKLAIFKTGSTCTNYFLY